MNSPNSTRAHRSVHNAILVGWCIASLGVIGCRSAVELGSPPITQIDPRASLMPVAPGIASPNANNPSWVTEAPRIDLFEGVEAPLSDVPSAIDFPLGDVCAPIINPPQEEYLTDGCVIESEVPLVSTGRAEAGCATCQTASGDRWGKPRDEYLCDGGDRGARARVRNNWQIDGLQVEDTIAHFDTLSGDIQVVPSNRACVYAPRFASVRKVTRLVHEQINDFAMDDRQLVTAANQSGMLEAGSVKQPEAPVRAVGTDIGNSLEVHQSGLLVDDVRQPFEARNQVLPFEGLNVLEFGIFESEETPRILEGVAAAQIWSAVEMAQVLIDNQLAYEQKGIGQAQAEIVYEMPEGKPRLRLLKMASECDALAGDIVHFVIRFDNVGNEPIGNVTIVDKLTPRLAYVADSQDCSAESEFIADDQSGETLSLRWEIDEPLKPGEGGVIRFQCRVR